MASLIKCYGLSWREDWVLWNATPRTAGLWCYKPGAKNQTVNMQDQAGIYVLYEGRNIVYVGQAGSGQQNLFTRLKNHRSDHLAERWDTFSWFGLRKVNRNGNLAAPNKRTAPLTIAQSLNQIEGVLIAAAEPRLNKQGGRFGASVVQYMQQRDKALGHTEPEMLRLIMKKLEIK